MSQASTTSNMIRSTGSLPAADSPCLPEWMLAVPGVKRIIARMGATEFRRRLFHMTPALLPLSLPFIPHTDVWGVILTSLILIFSIVAMVVAFLFGPLLTRRNEQTWSHAVIGYIIPVVAPLLLLPGQGEFGLMTLQIIALGDGSATFGGKMIGGPRLPWNRQKSFAGLFCFAIIGSLAATYSFWGEIRPVVSIGTSFLICATASLCAAIVESLPIRSNDNLRVGTTALITGMSMSAWLL